MMDLGMRAYLVDDDKTNLMLVEQIARRVDPTLQTESFLDPQDFLDRCRALPPDMALIDFMMPGIDGHELLRLLRAMPAMKDVPIVMLTAVTERSVRQKALELGATDFVTKPIEASEVKARLANLLALRRNHLLLAEHALSLGEQVRLATRTIHEREEELIIRLARAAEYRDPETGAHITRMALYSRLIGEQLGWDEAQCDLIQRAAPMHDIGKMGIPDAILLKPGRLDPNEMSIMRQHPAIGHAILQGSESHLLQLGAEIALTHHEKFDGSGYPAGLSGERIPISGRIVAIADVFDALTSARPYKEAWEIGRARQFLADNEGLHFDPALLAAFFAVWPQVLAIHQEHADPIEDALTQSGRVPH